MATLTIQEIPIGSQYTESIGTDDPAGLNDFAVRLSWGENVTGLLESSLSVSSGSIVSLEGQNSVWTAVVRPPETAAVITFTVATDAVDQGNAETEKDIRISTSFPDADAEVPTELFDSVVGAGLAVTPTRLLTNSTGTIRSYDYSGTEQVSERLTLSGVNSAARLIYINGDVVVSGQRVTFQTGDAVSIPVPNANRLVHTRLGYISSSSSELRLYRYGETTYESLTSTGITFSSQMVISHQNDLLYIGNLSSGPTRLAEITENDEVRYITRLNIDAGNGNSSYDMYQDTLYFKYSSEIYTLDIRPYRPIAKNTKTTIYPVFANEGETIPLKPYCPDAHTITFDVGFDKPTYLSINADNELEIASNAVTETQPVLVKLTGINYIDSIDFEFYLIIVQAANPTVRDVDDLAMYASTTFDLFDIVDNATAITFRSGQTQPTGSSISSGVFTIGTAGGTAYFTATNANGSTHFEIVIDVVSVDADNFSDTFRYRTEIAGIDVSADVKGTPTVSESIDAVRLNVNTANRVNLTLRSDSTNGFKFNGGIADNFWDANSLNADGFQEPIKVYIESLISGSYVRSLLFSGRIHEPAASISEAEVRISAVDITTRLRNTLVSDFGTLTKWDALKQQSDAVNYEGVNVPESSLLPIQLGTGTAWSDRTKLDISRLPLSSEGPVESNTGYLTTQDFRTAGGFLASLPVLRFKTEHRAEDVRFLFKQLGINKDIYQTQIDIPAIERDTPFILNRGSVPFSVEDTRITRLPTDWVHDSTNDRVLTLLSNPESHVADLLVQYNLDSDTYRSLHTFDKDISVHRIARRTSTDYYILSAKAISQDRSAADLPRTVDKTAYAFDSAAVGSAVKVYAYNTNTGVLTAHVEETDTYPAQLGIHYHVGFENTVYIDEYEGITSDYRGAFPVQSGTLYYRYAKDGEFGIASVDTSGTTTGLMSETNLGFHNHLNFAFDVTSGGDIYFVYATGDNNVSTLVIKRRTSGGTETTILTEERPMGNIVGFSEGFGAFLGAHEALFHDDDLYILAPIQAVDLGEEAQSFTADPDITIEQLSPEKTGERNVTTATNTNPTSTRLAPGDDIPIRIDFDGTVTGATESDLTVYGGTIQSFSISSDMIDVTIRPDDLTAHKNIVIDLAEDAVDETNEAWRITIDFGTRRSRTKAAGSVIYRCDVTAGTPTLSVIEKYDFATHGACNLTLHENSVHFVEQPQAAAVFRPINSDL